MAKKNTAKKDAGKSFKAMAAEKASKAKTARAEFAAKFTAPIKAAWKKIADSGKTPNVMEVSRMVKAAPRLVDFVTVLTGLRTSEDKGLIAWCESAQPALSAACPAPKKAKVTKNGSAHEAQPSA